MAKAGKQSSGRNRQWCSAHRPRVHESQLSSLLVQKVKWYRRERDRLIASLGGKCVDCGTTEELEFDELVARPPGMPRPNKTSRWQRLRNYLKLWKWGQEHGIETLTVRCRVHNAERGEPPHETLPHGDGGAPF